MLGFGVSLKEEEEFEVCPVSLLSVYSVFTLRSLSAYYLSTPCLPSTFSTLSALQ